MDIQTIEQDIVNRLSPLRQAGLEVKALPDEIARLTSVRGNGWVLVMFPEDQFNAPETRRPVTQSGLLTCRIDIRLKSLRSLTIDNCWLVLKTVRQLLLGFQPTGAKNPMYAVSASLQGTNNGYWHWFSEFRIPVLIRGEDPDSNRIDPLLRQITYLFEAGNREETVDLTEDPDEQLVIDEDTVI
jgi:hypothetical protein